MSPLKRKKLNKIRLELDKLDNSLIKRIKQRTNLVKQVLKLKDKKKEIIDNKRINRILNNIRKKSITNKIDPKITHRIWKNMIWAYINYEKRNFKRKELFTVRRKFFFNKNFMLTSSRIIFFRF